MEELQVKENFEIMTIQKELKNYITQIQQGIAVDAKGCVTALVNAKEALSALKTQTAEQLIDTPTEGLLMPIEYIDSCPTIEGYPIWERIPGEALADYDLFKSYLQMLQMDCPQRSVFRLSLTTQQDIPKLETLRLIYHWGLRAQAYDDYQTGNRFAILELRRRDIEDRHANAGKTLTNMALEYLTNHQEMLTPKVALQVLDVATKLERTSVGLSSGREPEGRVNVNVANTFGTTAAVVESKTISGNVDTDKDRLMQVLNIMNNIGVLKQTVPSEIIDMEVPDGEST